MGIGVKQKQMIKFISALLLLSIGLLSCGSSQKKIDRLEITKQYYNFLNNPLPSGMTTWFADSLVTIEGGYEQSYSAKAYHEFSQWDAVFDPTYTILDMGEEGEIVNVKISKRDKRISFLLEEPFITDQTLTFVNDKITTVKTEYINFNSTIWEQNKNDLLSYIGENHPELKGFLYDQTKAGGMKFLKAIELYKKK